MSNENDYFHAKEQDLLHEAKRQKEREELKQNEISHIEKLLSTTKELAEKVYDLGFDAESARIIHLIPVIQVAWADGLIQKAEKEKLIQLAELRGLDSKTKGPGWGFFELITSRQPEPEFFDQVNQLIAELIQSGEGKETAGTLLENCKKIAETSGGFLFGRVHKKEEELLEEFKKLFQ